MTTVHVLCCAAMEAPWWPESLERDHRGTVSLETLSTLLISSSHHHLVSKRQQRVSRLMKLYRQAAIRDEYC